MEKVTPEIAQVSVNKQLNGPSFGKRSKVPVFYPVFAERSAENFAERLAILLSKNSVLKLLSAERTMPNAGLSSDRSFALPL